MMISANNPSPSLSLREHGLVSVSILFWSVWSFAESSDWFLPLGGF